MCDKLSVHLLVNILVTTHVWKEVTDTLTVMSESSVMTTLISYVNVGFRSKIR